MCAPQRGHHFLLPLLWEHGLEPQLGDSLLASRRPDRRICSLAAEERSRPGGVPRAALVVADPARARLEERVAHFFERLARYEDDELAVQISVSICARCSLPL